MKIKFILPFTLVTLVLFSACEKEVDIELENAEPFLTVDAWLTDQPGAQTIRLTYTQPYFDNSIPDPALGAQVSVVELETQQVFPFTDEDGDGYYQWTPTDLNDSFGRIGRTYALNVDFNNVSYNSVTRMDSVPPVDSITFEYNKKNLFSKEDFYVAEFWSRDLPGPGNTYWIKTWKNGEYLEWPEEMNFAYDAGFSAAGVVDSLIFIQPIRTTINRFESNDDNLLLPPYSMEDSIQVEIHSISNAAWFFLYRLQEEILRPGSFAELFATPLANVPTNIIPSEEGVPVVGFFNVAAVSSLSVVVNEETIRDEDPD